MQKQDNCTNGKDKDCMRNNTIGNNNINNSQGINNNDAINNNNNNNANNPNESMFWADQIAREVKARVESSDELQKLVKEHGYFVYDEKTPSGEIHIGSGRGWIMHDVIVKAMKSIGLNARFVLSADDIDPFDKMNKELPVEYEKYLGMPFINIPSPVEGYKSFADYYFRQCTDKFAEFGIDCSLESTAEQYKNGLFNKFIKIALDNNEMVSAVFEEMYNKPYGRLPFNPICENCGKIGTTKAIKWDSEKELLYYECLENFVKWAKGCGHNGWISPYNGNGKFPWKIEWAAKWPAKGVICEFAGKDHFTKLGSRDVAIRIADRVFNSHVPYPSKVEDKNGHKIYTIGLGYEFFNIGGKKMSTSKGEGIGFAEATNFLPAHMIRYLLVRARPNAVVDFDPYGRNDIILLYDRFDKTERIYFGVDKVSDSEFMQAKRIYELSHVGKLPKKCPLQISLTYASLVLQVGMNEDGVLKILKKTGHLPKKITNEQLKYIKQRLNEAKHWLEHIASEEYKFELQAKVTLKVNSNEKKALLMVSEKMDQNDYTDEELHNLLYDICREANIETKDFFKAAYKALINRENGPRLAPFLNAIGKEKIKDIVMQLE